RFERAQVGHLPLRAAGVHAAYDGAPDRAAVEGRWPVRGQQLVRPSKVRVPEDAVDRGYLPVAQEHFARLGILAQLVDVEAVVASPVALDPFRQPESLSGSLDR